MQCCYFLTQSNKFLTITPPKSTPKYLCFANKVDAFRCKHEILEYVSKYNEWPSFDMGKDRFVTEGSSNDMSAIDFIDIENIPECDMIEMSGASAVGFLICHSFDTERVQHNKFSLRFTAQDVDPVIDINIYIEKLENIVS